MSKKVEKLLLISDISQPVNLNIIIRVLSNLQVTYQRKQTRFGAIELF